MRLTFLQKLAIGALVSVLVLMHVGAIVRVTGAGMGCPDWPTCWGRLIPPTSIEQVDFSKLDIERFRAKAKHTGRDPSTITTESLRAEFNARHVWTEFLNRLTSFPVGLFTLATCVVALAGWRKYHPWVVAMSVVSFVLVLVNAWMGARIVYSGLSPGVVTTHLALAMLLIATLSYVCWAANPSPWRIHMPARTRLTARLAVAILLVVVVTEGIMGSQVRELTDELAKSHLSAPRHTWIATLEHSPIYLLHRSFSWLVLLSTVWAWSLSHRQRQGGAGIVEHVALGIVLAQMVLGLVMSRFHIYAWAQVLHVGLAAILLAITWLWWFGLRNLDDTSEA